MWTLPVITYFSKLSVRYLLINRLFLHYMELHIFLKVSLNKIYIEKFNLNCDVCINVVFR